MPPKKPSLADEVAGNSAPAPAPPSASTGGTGRTLSNDILERLDQMNVHLQNLDRRDRLRMVGSSIRSLISLGMLVFVIWSSVYLLYHMQDIIKIVTEETAKATMQYGKSGSVDLMKQLEQYMPKK